MLVAHPRHVTPLRARALLLAALLSTSLALSPPPAAARQPDRALGLRFERDLHNQNRAPRQERRRLRFDAPTQDVQLTARQIRGQLPGLKQRLAAVGATVEQINPPLAGAKPSRYPIFMIHLPATKTTDRPHTRAGQPLRVLVSSGVHGDETAGIATALALVEQALKQQGLRRDFALDVMVKLDPYRARTTHGANLNRSFAPGRELPETLAIQRAVKGQQYDLHIDLHGDDEQRGFFFEKVADPNNALTRALRAMETGALLDASPRQPFAGGPGGYWMQKLGWSIDYKNDVPGAQNKSGKVLEDHEGFFDRYMAVSGKVPYVYTMEIPRMLTPEQQLRGGMKLLRSVLYNVAAAYRQPR
jgi:hypothetical protein